MEGRQILAVLIIVGIVVVFIITMRAVWRLGNKRK